jgi:hypothetical protein
MAEHQALATTAGAPDASKAAIYWRYLIFWLLLFGWPTLLRCTALLRRHEARDEGPGEPWFATEPRVSVCLAPPPTEERQP